MQKAFAKKSKVQWKYLGRAVEGFVVRVYREPITVALKGKRIKRNGSKENPAYLVESVSGNRALKLQSELEKGLSLKAKRKLPQCLGDSWHECCSHFRAC